MAKITVNTTTNEATVQTEAGLMSAITDTPGALMGSEENTYYSTGVVRTAGLLAGLGGAILGSKQGRKRQREGKKAIGGMLF